MTYSPDDAAAMAQYLIESGLGPTAQEEAMVQAAAAQAERILARLGYSADKVRRPAAPEYPAPDDGDADRAVIDHYAEELTSQMAKGDLGRAYRYPKD